MEKRAFIVPILRERLVVSPIFGLEAFNVIKDDSEIIFNGTYPRLENQALGTSVVEEIQAIYRTQSPDGVESLLEFMTTIPPVDILLKGSLEDSSIKTVAQVLHFVSNSSFILEIPDCHALGFNEEKKGLVCGCTLAAKINLNPPDLCYLYSMSPHFGRFCPVAKWFALIRYKMKRRSLRPLRFLETYSFIPYERALWCNF